MLRRGICEICSRQGQKQRGFSTGNGLFFPANDDNNDDVMKNWAHLFDVPKPNGKDDDRNKQGLVQDNDDSPLASLTRVLMRESGQGKGDSATRTVQPPQSLYDTTDIGSTWKGASPADGKETISPSESSPATAAAAASSSSGFGPGSATQKERDIFARIFDTILSSPNGIRNSKGGGSGGSATKRGGSNHAGGGKEKNLNLSAVFAREDGNLAGLDPSGSRGGRVSASSGSVSGGAPGTGEMTLGKTLSELLKYPKSLQVPLRNNFKTKKGQLGEGGGSSSSVILGDAFGQEPLTEEEIEREKIRRQEFIQIKQDMDECKVDFELEKYMKENVLSLFGKEKVEKKNKISLDNYSHALCYGIESLAWGFEAPTTAIYVFEEAKRVDIQSYLTGCTIQVYNKVLKIRWELYGDLFAVNSLIDEMEMNGIEGNQETIDFVYETTTVISRMLERNQRLIQGSGIDRLDYNLQGLFVWSAEDQVQFHRLQNYQINLLKRVAQRNQARQQELVDASNSSNNNDDDLSELLQL